VSSRFKSASSTEHDDLNDDTENQAGHGDSSNETVTAVFETKHEVMP
jgi:hypothetical protein